MRVTLRLLLAAGLLWGLLPAAAAAQDSPFSPAIVVNDRVITYYEVDQRLRLLRSVGTPGANAEDIVRDSLIEEALMMQEAERRGIELPDSNIEQAIERFAANRNLSPAELRRRMARQGAEQDTLVNLVRAQFSWRDAMQARFNARAAPSDADVDEAIVLATTEPDREVLLAEIAIPIAERGPDETVAFIRQLFAQLANGGDFRAAARTHGRTAAAQNDGIVGWLRPATLPANMRRQVEVLSPGDITAPIPITRGVTILSIYDERFVPSEDAERVELTYGKVDFPDTAAARAARTEITSCETAAERGALVGPLTLSDVDPDLFTTLAQANEGVVSTPVETAEGSSLVILCARNVDVSQEERRNVTNNLFVERVNTYASGYLQELRSQAVIEER
ncbi:MAG: peptidylprolyl isomerase [Pseudomonadota bacterium]